MNKTLLRIEWSTRIFAARFILLIFILLTLTYLAANANSVAVLKGDYRFIRNRRAEILSDENKNKASCHEISPLGFTANSLLTIYQTFVSSLYSELLALCPRCHQPRRFHKGQPDGHGSITEMSPLFARTIPD